jgi:hypothetical protein
LKDKYGVVVKFYQERSRIFDKRDFIASMKGTIDNVQYAIIIMIKRIQKYLRSTYEGKDSYTVKMLINKIIVTKLIGAKGCMIQEIANVSGGASIKILSKREDEERSDSSDVITSVAGSFGSIQDAICMIIEQMECFKKGGPVRC